MRAAGKLDPVGKLFRDAWRLFDEKGWGVFKVVVIPLFLLSLPRFFGKDDLVGLSIAALLALLGLILFIPAIPAAIEVYNSETSSGAAYRRGWTMFWGLVWLVILQVCTVFGGFVMLIIPGILLAIWFSLSQIIFVLEGKRGMEVLARSRAYVSGYWWATLGRTLLMGLVVIGISIVLMIPFGLALGTHLGAAVTALIIDLAVFPFGLAYSYVLYQNFKRLKPEVSAGAATQKKMFIKVAAIVGLVGAILSFCLS